jgi:hypothetical protein
MHLKENVHTFARACEHLIAGIALYRPLTHDEVLLIKHYCNEVLTKIDPPPNKS